MRTSTRRLIASATGLLLAGSVTACGSKSETTAAGAGAGGAGGAGGSKEIVVFIPSSTNRYIQQWEAGAKEKAAKLGYTVRILEAGDKDTQSQQVDQQLAAATKPAGYVWWPTANEALVGKLTQLGASGVPVIQTNQLPIKGTEKSWTAYAGVNDILNGQYAGEMLMDACKSAAKACKDGIIARFPTGYSAGDDRITGFKKAAGSLNVLQTVDTGGFQEKEGYDTTKSVVAANKDKISWVYGNNDAIAAGVIQALEESGLKPGKDVLVVGGTCHGDSSNLLGGKLVGTAIQPAFLEGYLSVQVLNQYLKNGKKVEDGEFNVPPDANTPPSDDAVPHKYNFMPNPKIAPTQKAYDEAKIWGYSMKQLCDY